MAEPYVAILTSGVAVYMALFLVAAASDAVRFVIPNAVVVALAALFCLVAVAVPLGTDWIDHLGSAALVLVIGIPIYRFRILGAGDIKLLTAGSLWMGFDVLPMYIVHVTIAGAALGLSLLLVRYVIITFLLNFTRGSDLAVPRLLVPGEGIPYGVAIAVASVMMAGRLPHLGLYL